MQNLNHSKSPPDQIYKFCQNFSSTLHWGQAHGVTNARKSERTFLRLQKGYSCYELDQSKTILQVLPSEFLPEELCACLPGWSGKGADCSECPVNTYKPDLGAAACTPCKSNATTRYRGSKSELDCEINPNCNETFRAHEKGKQLNDTCPMMWRFAEFREDVCFQALQCQYFS